MKKLLMTAGVAAMLAVIPASAARADHECQPNKIGTVVYYQSPNGWITIHIPLCFGPD